MSEAPPAVVSPRAVGGRPIPRTRAGTANTSPQVTSSISKESSSERRRSVDGRPLIEKRAPPPRPPRIGALAHCDVPSLRALPASPRQSESAPASPVKRHLPQPPEPSAPAKLEPPPAAISDTTVQQEELAKRARNSEELVKELLATERVYVGDLSLIIKLYLRPLETTKKDLLLPQERLTIFSNLESILPLNEQLLAGVEEEANKPSAERRIGRCFLRLVDYLKMYQVYCGNQGEALSLLDKIRKKRKEWLAFCESVRQLPECRKLGLGDLLIKPMQRLCRYPLLIAELARLLPEDHADRETLIAAKDRLEQVVKIANEARRQYEAHVALRKMHKHLTLTTNPTFILIIPARYLMRRATLRLWSHKVAGKEKITSTVKRELILFNDIIMVCELRDKKLTERALCETKNAIAWELGGDEKHTHSFGLVRTDAPDTMSFECENEAERAAWISAVLSAAAEARK